MAGSLTGDFLEIKCGAVKQFQGACDSLQEIHPVPFRRLESRPGDAAHLGHRRKSIVHFRGITIRLPRVAPSPVDAEASFAPRICSRGVVLVVRPCWLYRGAHDLASI